ncbi:FadR/GntR family transcriptional regulator [Frigoribacterium sp. CG_9.8]|uniref:FadR/GntR family transcriptional regulator n=1 Tax=Frigoribacterium sp. CG_9.8 TaxID=2787733 RepID=UPI0018C91043|nr:FCD domain-containing protein [Frigoribacterium sp. CG_9.8]MBG6106827.1 DNA-binding FadR family transcriptional regulator [Frigoribacterium sp. CG_9.8]
MSNADSGLLRADVAGDALFRPVRAGNAFEETVSRLLQAIRLGIVPPGEALPAERDLAIRFSVSRDTVREAIRSLSDAGFLVSRRGRYGGTFVVDEPPTRVAACGIDGLVASAPPTAEEIEDVLALREILEVGAARSAAGRSLVAGDRELLWMRLGETATATVADYRRLDSRLHLTIGELVGAPSLVPMIAENRMRVNSLLDDIPLLQRNIEHSNQQHERIVIAILTGDAEGAASAMQEHLEGSAALLRGFLA